jgi:hypothetical protein
MKVDENRTMTVLLGDNGKVVYYVGLLATPIAGPKDITLVKTVFVKNCFLGNKSTSLFCSKGSLKRINCNCQVRNQIIKI